MAISTYGEGSKISLINCKNWKNLRELSINMQESDRMTFQVKNSEIITQLTNN